MEAILEEDGLQLETVYCSGPLPRNTNVFTILGVVFDKVHFPGVYLPRDGYDPHELQREICRLEALPQDAQTAHIVAMLKGVQAVKELEHFCVFAPDKVSSDRIIKIAGQSADDMFYVLHGPQRDGFVPSIDVRYSKGIPGSDEEVTYPGAYHYVCGALSEAEKRAIPVLNDDRLLAQRIATQSLQGDVTALATLLAIESVRVVLPEVAAMPPGVMVDFREQNKESLRVFRRGMVRSAAKLDGMIRDGDTDRIAERTKFFIDTEIRPALDELRSDICKSNRPWSVRASDTAIVSGSIVAGYYAAGATGAAIAGFGKAVEVLGKEQQAAHDARERRKKIGLSYLLEVERFTR